MDRKILIAEDEVSNLKTYLEFFKNKPVKVLHAINGEKAVAIAKQEMPDLIIMDWNMPVMDGVEATKKLQELEITMEIPVIISTGIMTSPEDLQVALDSGAYDYIRKPFDPIELTARINSALTLSDSFKRIKQLLKNEKEYLKTELERRERELSMAMTFKHKITEFINEIDAELIQLHKLSPEPLKVLIKEVINKTHKFSDVDQALKEFRFYFEKMHPNFFKRLQTNFPGLTNHENRLCAFLKLGMGNKEIARINNVAVDSVKKSITRLKKKMNIVGDITLRDFISDF